MNVVMQKKFRKRGTFFNVLHYIADDIVTGCPRDE
jgi:hypothetical protein